MKYTFTFKKRENIWSLLNQKPQLLIVKVKKKKKFLYQTNVE